MPNHKIITISGTDRSGKECQSRLLEKLLTPSKRLSFPDYTHWSGQIIKAILQEEEFGVSRGTTETGAFAGTYTQEKEAYTFQMLQGINRSVWKDRIIAGKKRHHWIMDRYEVDAIPYGMVDGCELRWLSAMSDLYVPSDLAIVLLGKGWARNGEVPDQNERQPKLQKRVSALYRLLASANPEKYAIIEVDSYWNEDPATGIALLQNKIAEVLKDRLKLRVTSMEAADVRHVLGLEYKEA